MSAPEGQERGLDHFGQVVQHPCFSSVEEQANHFAPTPVLCLTVCTLSEKRRKEALAEHSFVVVHMQQELPSKVIRRLEAPWKHLRIASHDQVAARFSALSPNMFENNTHTIWTFSRAIQRDLMLAAERCCFIVPTENPEESLMCNDIFSLVSLCNRGVGNQLVWMPTEPESDAIKHETGADWAHLQPAAISDPEIQRKVSADTNGGLIQFDFAVEAGAACLERLRALSATDDAEKMPATVLGEGALALERALDSSLNIEFIILRLPKFEEVKEQIFVSKKSISVIIASNQVLRALCEEQLVSNADAIIVAVTRPPNIPLRNCSRLVALDNLDNPENVGSIIRTAHCFGADGIILSPNCASAWHRRSIRVSMGHIFQLGVQICEEPLSEWLKRVVKEDHFEAYAAVVQQETALLHHVTPSQKWIVVLGNEHLGISQEVRTACQTQVKIDLQPNTDSLNVYVAGSIILHHFETCSK